MKRNSVLKILNPILGVLALSQILTGLLGDFLPQAVFKIVHLTGGIAFAAAAATHVTLNWGWVKANFWKSQSAGQP